MGRLDGRIAFVTGGARGIGRAIAGKFAAEGATVTFADLDEAAGQETATELTAAGRPVTFCRADVTVEADVQRAIEGVMTRHGTLDVLVNNAGVNAYFDATEMTGVEWDRVFGVDLKSAWLCAKHALPAMKRAGRGSIVNIASIHAVLTIPGMFPYAAAKAGLLGLTRSLALEYGPAGIRVNAVLPGYTRTRLVEEWLRTQPNPVAAEQRVLEVQPLRRMAEPAEIANLVAFVASDEASAITGASLAADCGLGVMFANLKTLTMDCVLDVKAELGEGPVWDPDTGCLYFVDIERGAVHRYDPVTTTSQSFQVGTMVGAAALTEAGDLVLAVRDGFARLDLDSGEVRLIADVEADLPDQRMNDGKCDPAGRFWAGTMALDKRRGAGALYRLDPDGRVTRMLDGVSISNGLDWSDDGRLMYYVDTPTRSIDMFDFDVATGAIANRRSLVLVERGEGWPDGLTVDADGHIWVALWAGAAVRRYAPDGTLDRVVAIPTTYPTSCAFGGPDLRDLYVTTAATALTPDERLREPLAGGLFRCRPGVQGRPPRRFKG